MVSTLQSVYDILTLTVEIIHINYFVVVADCCYAYVSINQSTVERRGNSSLPRMLLPRTSQFLRGYPQATQAQLTCTLASLDENTSMDVDIT